MGLCPWMGLLIALLEFLKTAVGVHLRGGQTGVSEQLLDGIEVGTMVEQMRGETVPQHVWASFVNCGYHG